MITIKAAAITVEKLGKTELITIFHPTKAAIRAVDRLKNDDSWEFIRLIDGVKRSDVQSFVSDGARRFVSSRYDERIDVIILTVLT